MIFPEYTAHDWIKRYPYLEIMRVKCRHCRNELETDTPYLSKDYAGLCIKNDTCIHCGGHHRAHNAIPISQKEIALWKELEK